MTIVGRRWSSFIGWWTITTAGAAPWAARPTTLQTALRAVAIKTIWPFHVARGWSAWAWAGVIGATRSTKRTATIGAEFWAAKATGRSPSSQVLKHAL